MARRAKLHILTAVLSIVSVLVAQTAHAATFAVDDLGVSGDVTPGDGACATSTSTCTFIAALTEANAASTADVITLPGGTWTLGAWIDFDLEIAGVGTAVTIIDGGRGSSTLYTGAIFLTRENVAFTLRGVTVQNGWSAVMAGGPLTVVDSVIRDHADSGLHCPLSGSTVIENSTLNNNRAVNGGGAVSCSGPLLVSGSSFNSNYAGNVGGAISTNGPTDIVGSTFVLNRAGNSGGAVHADGSLDVSSSTFKSNSAFNVGGAISSTASLDVVNSTFVGNGAGNTGGGLHLDGATRLNNVTIIGNSCGNTGAGISIGDGSVRIGNSILYGNTGQDCADENYFSDGYNFFESECAGVATSTDHVGVAPLTGPLGNNGGGTQTVPLLSGSAAIDAGGPGCEAMDQRGIPRPQGAACDVGAYEALTCDFDGVVDSGEQCDDGNTIDGDGCSSLCETELLAGRKLHLEGSASGTGKLKVQFTDARVALGFGNFSMHDPVIHGGSIRITSTAGDGVDVTLPLPADGWQYIGKAGSNRGYKYKVAGGSVQQVRIQPGRQIKVKGSGPLDVGLSGDPNPVQVVITIGSRHYCSQYGGDTRFERNRYFRAKKAPPPPAMP